MIGICAIGFLIALRVALSLEISERRRLARMSLVLAGEKNCEGAAMGTKIGYPLPEKEAI